MSCIPTFSCGYVLAANEESARTEVAAKALRRVTRVFIGRSPVCQPSLDCARAHPRRKRSGMIAFQARGTLLLQWIERGSARCVVLGQRVRPATLGKLAVFQARRLQHRGMTIISFDAARLVEDPVFLFALFAELLNDLPGPCPHGRILDDRDIFKRGRTGARPAFDEVQV